MNPTELQFEVPLKIDTKTKCYPVFLKLSCKTKKLITQNYIVLKIEKKKKITIFKNVSRQHFAISMYLDRVFIKVDL